MRKCVFCVYLGSLICVISSRSNQQRGILFLVSLICENNQPNLNICENMELKFYDKNKKTLETRKRLRQFS